MKIKRVSFNDDGVLIPGILIKRAFRKEIFFSMEIKCGWDSQVITKAEKKNIMPYQKEVVILKNNNN